MEVNKIIQGDCLEVIKGGYMFLIRTKKEYEYTKKLLKMFIAVVRKQREGYSKSKAMFLNSGYISQIKEFIQQLRQWRKLDKRRAK